MSKLSKLFLATAVASVSTEDRVEDAVAVVEATPTDDTRREAEEVVVMQTTEAAPEVAAEIEEVVKVEEQRLAGIIEGQQMDQGIITTEEPVVVQAAAENEVVDETAVVEEMADEEDDSEAGENARELVRAVADAREMQSARCQLESVRESATDLRDTVAAINEAGGLSVESFKFLNLALEAHANICDRPPILLGIDLESFQGEDAASKQVVSLEDLDELIGQFNTADNCLNERIASAESFARELTKHIAPPAVHFALSLEGEGDEVIERGIDPDALREAQGADQVRQCEDSFNELENAENGIADIRDEIAAQNESGGLSVESIVLASLALEAYSKPLGLPEITLVDSLENIKPGELTIVDLQNVDASLEGIGDAVKAVGGAVADGYRKAVTSVKNSLNMLNGTLPKTIEALEAALKKVDTAKGSTQGTVDAKVLAKRVHKSGKVPSDLVGYFTIFFAFAAKFMTSFMTASQTAFRENIKLFSELDGNSVPGFFASLHKVAGQWKNPNDSLSAADLKMTAPGGGEIFENIENVYGGDNADAQKLDKVGSENLVAGSWVRPNRKLMSKVDSLPALSIAECKKLLTAALATLKGIKTENLEVSSRIWADAFKAINRRDLRRGNVAKTARGEIAAARRAFEVSYYTALTHGWQLAREAVFASKTAIMYVNASLATIETASKEDLDQGTADLVTDKGTEEVSLEALVKELKSGKKVKFSHGHGKVVKVFTAPFKYKGKVHHASKEDPRIEVRADKGGHLSIHKAGSLTLI